MIKLLNFLKISSRKYIFLLAIFSIIFGISYLTYFPNKTYFSCKVELTNSDRSSDLYKIYITVNRYFFGYKYSLNDFKISQCSYIEYSELTELDSIYCSNDLNGKNEETLSFNIIDKSVVIINDPIYGSYTATPFIAFNKQECEEIEK